MDLVNISYFYKERPSSWRSFFICFNIKNNYQKADLCTMYKWLIAGYLMTFIEKRFIMN